MSNVSCAYISKKWTTLADNALSSRCICLCDDDNDVEMALACLHAYIPLITSKSMADTIRSNPNHFTVAIDKENDGDDHTKATERALSLVLTHLRSKN